jgi:hypothetical protein
MSIPFCNNLRWRDTIADTIPYICCLVVANSPASCCAGIFAAGVWTNDLTLSKALLTWRILIWANTVIYCSSTPPTWWKLSVFSSISRNFTDLLSSRGPFRISENLLLNISRTLLSHRSWKYSQYHRNQDHNRKFDLGRNNCKQSV